MKVKIIHCDETGSRRIWVVAKIISGEPSIPMQLVDPGIGIGNACMVDTFSTGPQKEIELVFGITCSSVKIKKALEAYLSPSYWRSREHDANLTLESFIEHQARELEFRCLNPAS